MSRIPFKPKNRFRNTATGAASAVLLLAISTIGVHEGLRTVAYKDVVGVPTVCFGETRGVKMGDRYTVDECKAMLGEAIVEFAERLDKCLAHPERIPDKTYVALLSWSYNVGSGAACKSTLVRKANAGDLKGACAELLKWTKAGSRVIRGLVTRRNEERALCDEGVKEGPPRL